MVEVAAGEIPGRDIVTQEPTPPEVILEVQDVQFGTSGDKVCTQLPQNFINVDSDNEEHLEEEEILKLTEELSILRIEVRKWRSQVERYQEGMVSLIEHRNTIRDLKEKWAEELMTQKLRGEELQKELKELKKLKSMQVEKDQLYTLS